jgi:hypothetical protein
VGSSAPDGARPAVPGGSPSDESPPSSGHVRFGGASVGRARPTTISNRTRSGHEADTPRSQACKPARTRAFPAKRTCPPDNRTTCPVRVYGDPSRSPVRTGRTVFSYRGVRLSALGVDFCLVVSGSVFCLCLFSFSVSSLRRANPAILRVFPRRVPSGRRAGRWIGREFRRPRRGATREDRVEDDGRLGQGGLRPDRRDAARLVAWPPGSRSTHGGAKRPPRALSAQTAARASPSVR